MISKFKLMTCRSAQLKGDLTMQHWINRTWGLHTIVINCTSRIPSCELITMLMTVDRDPRKYPALCWVESSQASGRVEPSHWPSQAVSQVKPSQLKLREAKPKSSLSGAKPWVKTIKPPVESSQESGDNYMGRGEGGGGYQTGGDISKHGAERPQKP